MRYLLLALITTYACGGPGYVNSEDENLRQDQMDPETAKERCTPGALACRGAAIVECGEDGLLAKAEPITGCVDPVLDTCAVCPGETAPTCVAAVPPLTGSVIGLGSPEFFEDTGCGGALHTLRYDSSRAQLILNVDNMLTIGATIGSITSGVNFPAEAINPRMSVKVRGCSTWIGQPYAGTARVTWAEVEPGADVHFELEGPVSCDAGASWTDIRLDLTARITNVQ